LPRNIKPISIHRKTSGDLMLHTDRGVEYRGHVYQRVFKRHGIIHSLSRAGKCTYNTHMESFFHSMKTEVIRGMYFKVIKNCAEHLADILTNTTTF
jgi:transposase InsO family protein